MSILSRLDIFFYLLLFFIVAG